jgi:hypothetical protein
MRQTRPTRLFTTLFLVAAALVTGLPCTGTGIAHAAPISSRSSRPGAGGAAGIQAPSQARSAPSGGKPSACTFFPHVTACTSTKPAVSLEWTNFSDTSGCVFDYTIGWGDGTPDTTGTRTGGPPGTSLLARHTYKLSGVYDISMTGDVASGNCSFFPASAQFTYKGPCTAGDRPPSAPRQQFTSPAVNVGTRLTARLAASAGSTPILAWNLISQDFGTASWHFRWNGNGTFVIIRQSTNAVRFTYTATGTDGCTSKPATVTIGGTAGSFSSSSGRTQTPIYEVLGDSYSSGEGNPTFLPGTATDLQKNRNDHDDCHRSTKAYGYQQWKDNLLPKIKSMHLVFAACSGAEIANLLSAGQHPQGLAIDRQPQVTQVDKYQLDPKKYVRYISLTAGGNNARFAPILAYCIKDFLQKHHLSPSKCLSYAKKADHYNSRTGKYEAFAAIETQLKTLYQRLLDDAPDADIFVLDYPRLFNTGDPVDGCLINPKARKTLDQLEAQLNGDIKAAATANLRGRNRLHFIELDSKHSAFNAHNLCRPVSNQNRSWINGLETTDADSPVAKYTAHPDQRGHNWVESQLDAEMKKYL